MAYSTISKPSDNFNIKLYTGNSSTNAQTGVGFQPDLTWFKRRDNAAQHSLFDAVRGVTKALSSNSNSTETTISDALTSFDSDGFTLGADSGNYINYNSATYASWNWKAGTTSGLSGGTITPSAYSINATSGFGIYAYTGTNANGTITHGLGSAPSVIIVKNRLTSSKSWVVGHKSIGFQNALFLNSTDAQASEPNLFNSTAPTSSVFTVGTGSLINDSGDSYIAYAFTEKTGYSKFGSYIGNGSTDGTFVYLGFKPAFVILKVAEHAGSWLMFDNKRDGLNPNSHRVYANGSDAEDTGSGSQIDFLSNGFKGRSSDSSTNTINNKYLYMAFAEEPLVANVGASIPATAR